jgi:hypothetical protein
MPKRTARPRKPPNGQAASGTYLLTFDLDDPAQVVAWEKAQDLASQRKLKHVLTGLLLAIDTVERHTGKPVDMTVFMAQFVSNLVMGGQGMSTYTTATSPEELPSMFAGTEDRADPLAARQAFAGSMGNLFSDDDEDEWR